MKISSKHLPLGIFFIFFLFNISSVSAQDESEIVEAYEDYTEAAREVVYLHLNKSTFIKGETLGFKAYVMDKKDKKPSLLTTNLYVSIEDENQKTIKKKLVRVFDGVASNVFTIDSLFTSGHYNIKAYTNWMLNFNEQNHYAETVKIIDPEVEEYVEEAIVDNEIDAQFLPESGHLLHGIVNNVGVIIKDNLGFGIPNVSGEVVGKNDEVISTFQTNQLGIGKFPLLAEFGTNYKINVNHANKDFSFDLGHSVEKNGVVLSVKRLKTKLFASIITNSETLESIKNQRFTLMIHNGDAYEIMDVYFTDNTTVNKAIEYSNTPSGINILTLFNEDDIPVSERLFFNYEGINFIKSNDISATRKRDSLTIKLAYNAINKNELNSLSVSVLPQETQSYDRHNNIVSYTFIQPYIKGTVEKGKYYFTDITERKQYELDNLLITQGWSSYNWNNIFNDEYNQNYNFEQGIRLKANLSNRDLKGKSDNSYLMYAISEEEPRIFEVAEEEKSFYIDNLFPVGTNKINFSKMTKVNGLIPASLYIQSFPSIIPTLTAPLNVLKPKPDYKVSESLMKQNSIVFNKLDEVQNLEEVVVMSRLDRKRQRIEKLSQGRYGKVDVVEEEDRLLYNTLTNYLIAKGFNVDESSGGLVITDRYSSGGARPGFEESDSRNLSPVIFLDDVQILDTALLFQYSLTNIDYIEINRRGFGEGLRGGNGTIRIYSNSKISKSYNNWDTVQEYELPLVFSPEKTYYAPKYQNTGDAFYKAYGSVDWKPNLQVDDNGVLNVKIVRPRIPITLYVEGISNDGSFVFEEKSITLN
ncbi:hypothetical protein [Winogradskyella sp.]|uniref:hypothetical protein n=1 Tax=Winogradskyella sp. TaxID=1883156 RepID=UPI003F6B7146